MKLRKDLLRIKRRVTPLFRRYDVRKAAVFGSMARGEAGRTSDIDLLVKVPENMGLFDFIGLKQDLEEKLGRRVDLVSFRAIHPVLKKRILEEQIPIYEKRT